jgi:hypothetical protein
VFNGLDVGQLSRKPHGGHVNRGHLRRQHRLKLILRLEAFDH